MASVIAVSVCAVIFFVIYKLFSKNLFGEEQTKDWPKAEGTIVNIHYETNGSNIFVEFWDGGKLRRGKSIQYVGVWVNVVEGA